MKRKVLVNEIVDFCLYLKIFNRSMGIIELRKGIDEQLDNIEQVETLIKDIQIKAKKSKGIDIARLKKLVMGLESIRFDLDFKDYL